MKFKFIPLEVPDVILIEPKIFPDARGFFYEGYRRDSFSEAGIADHFVQDNRSNSCKGVLRGLHYQLPPMAQAKLVSVVAGKVLDIAVDIRRSSKTFGKHISVVLSGENRHMLYVPPGFAHGFCTLEDNTEFFYKVSNYYSPQNERGILWNDPALGIEWPKMPEYFLSDKDTKYPAFKTAEVFD